MSFRPHDRWLLGLLLAARLSVSLTYSLINPPWEAYDETGHFQYARYIATRGRLPLPGDPEAERIWSKFQPPAYYVLTAPVLALFGLGDTFQFPDLNPYLAWGTAGVNYAIHPDRLTGLAAREAQALLAVRVMGSLLSTASVLAMYAAARRLWPASRRSVWLATGLYAFWPQFLFIGGMATNDLLVTGLAPLALLLSIALVQDGPSTGRIAGLAALVLAAVLTKLNGLALIVPAGVGLWFSFSARQRLWAGLALAALGGTLVPALALLQSMQFVAEQVLNVATLEALAVNVGAIAAGSLDWAVAATTARYAAQTFFASYGWGNVEGPPLMYGAWYFGLGLAAVGWLLIGLRRSQLRPQQAVALPLGIAVLMLGGHLAAVVGLSVALAVAVQDVFLVVGRYLLPALPALIGLLIIGWRAMWPARSGRWAWKLPLLAAVAVSWAAPITVIARAYDKPQPAAIAEYSRLAEPVRFGQAIELVGHDLWPPISPGAVWRFRLCWRAVAEVSDNYPILIEVIGADGRTYGRHEGYAGDGNYPTSFWQPGQAFCDRYDLPIGASIPAPARAAVRIHVLTGPLGAGLPDPLAPEREANAAFTVKVLAPVRPGQPTHARHYQFADGIILRGYDLTGPGIVRSTARLTLYWEALTDIDGDFVVFVHLRDTPSSVLLQSDGRPRSNAYPTYLWEAGEVVADDYDFQMPLSGRLPPVTVIVGLYDSHTLVRLPVLDAQGRPVQNDEVILMREVEFVLPGLGNFAPTDFIYLPHLQSSDIPAAPRLPGGYP